VRRMVDGDDDVPHRLPSRVPANMLDQALSFLHQKVTLDPELQVSKKEIPCAIWSTVFIKFKVLLSKS
jgi:hypothetical protein